MRKSTIKMIAIALVACAAFAFIGHITGGFQTPLKDATLMDRNEDNLLTGKYGWKDDVYNVGDGYKLTASNDGTVKINGKYTGANGSAVIDLEKLTLSAGTYTISGAPNGGNATYKLQVSYGSSTVTGDFGAENGTFTLTTSTEVTVQLVIYDDFDFNNVSIRPVLVEGSEAGSFYAK